MPDEIVENVPMWAVQYLEYGDAAGLTDMEKAAVDDWVSKLADTGLELVCPIDGTEDEFCRSPAFGLACSTVDYAARRRKD